MGFRSPRALVLFAAPTVATRGPVWPITAEARYGLVESKPVWIHLLRVRLVIT